MEYCASKSSPIRPFMYNSGGRGAQCLSHDSSMDLSDLKDSPSRNGQIAVFDAVNSPPPRMDTSTSSSTGSSSGDCPKSCPRSFGSRSLRSGVKTQLLQASGEDRPCMPSTSRKRRLATSAITEHDDSRILFPASAASHHFSSLDEDDRKMSHHSYHYGHHHHHEEGEVEHEEQPQQPLVLSRYFTEFEEVKKIGKGSFGSVFLVKNRLDQGTYAIKRIHLRPSDMSHVADGTGLPNDLLYEVYGLSSLESPNILRYFSSWVEDEYLHIQTEYCDGGDLQQQLGTFFPEKQIREILKQVLSGLSLIHARGLAHLDIKNENIYMSQRPGGDVQYKIGDLGQIRHVNLKVEVTEGDGRYLCRELLDDDFRYLTKADIFALGASLYEMILGRRLPANGDDWQKIRNGDLFNFSLSGNYSPQLFSLIRRMMESDPLLRPSAAEILCSAYILNDPSMESEFNQYRERCRRMEEEIHMRAQLEQQLRSEIERLQGIVLHAQQMHRAHA
eukprot:ANDGO_02190.mRNA.1 Wee1-like protein kinase